MARPPPLDLNPHPGNVWGDHERGDLDYGMNINALENPEIISAATIDVLRREKQAVEAAERGSDRVKKLMKFMEDKDNMQRDSPDPLVAYTPGFYPPLRRTCWDYICCRR